MTRIDCTEGITPLLIYGALACNGSRVNNAAAGAVHKGTKLLKRKPVVFSGYSAARVVNYVAAGSMKLLIMKGRYGKLVIGC